VSHDRAFLNNVVTSSIVFEQGGAKEYVGGYDDWLRQRSQLIVESTAPVEARPSSQTAAKSDRKRRLSFKEQQELNNLPATIERLEAGVAALHEQMLQPEFYKQASDRIAETQARLKSLDAELTAAYARWQELEPLAG
jgi:ATP-binding cassette subfamily F protein uup